MTVRNKLKIKFIFVILLALVAGLISYPRAVARIPRAYDVLNKLQIKQGLDLQGGFHLEYKIDLSQVEPSKQADALNALQSIIEQRVNAFGVSEPLVYIKKSGMDEILVVELAGVKDINQAKQIIKETPLLEFKEEKIDTSNQIPQTTLDQLNAQQKTKADSVLQQAIAPGADFAALAKANSQDPTTKDSGGDLGVVKNGDEAPAINKVLFDPTFKDGTVYAQVVEGDEGWYILKKIATTGSGDAAQVHAAQIVIAKAVQPEPKTSFVSTGLTGKNLSNASVGFSNQALSEPTVNLEFDAEGTKLLADVSQRNIGKPLAIFLDNQMVEAPTVKSALTDGRAEISGGFKTVQDAQALVKSLNEGSLPMPIGDPIYEEHVDASLGQSSLMSSLKAGAIGLAIVLVFMIVYYRYLGFIASLALIVYTALMVAIFKLSGITPWGITFTLSGIAGFILSIGMAVDANVLIFERTKEELRKGRELMAAVDEGFHRAWPSIRDGNYSTILTSLILVWVGTGFVKGFAIILMIGVIMSMFTAIVLVKIVLRFTLGKWAIDRSWLIIRTKKKKEEENKPEEDKK